VLYPRILTEGLPEVDISGVSSKIQRKCRRKTYFRHSSKSHRHLKRIEMKISPNSQLTQRFWWFTTLKISKPVPPAKTSHWTMIIDEIKSHGAVDNPFFAFKEIKKYFKFCYSDILIDNFLLSKPSIWCIGI